MYYAPGVQLEGMMKTMRTSTTITSYWTIVLNWVLQNMKESSPLNHQMHLPHTKLYSTVP